MKILKKCLPDLLAVLLFAVLAFAYFFPADIEGRILYRHDASAGREQDRKVSNICRKRVSAAVGQMPCLVVCLPIRWRLRMAPPMC